MSILEILRHTPIWVWPLLLVVLALGLAQTVSRRMSLQRATMPSLLLAALSLAGVLTRFHGTGLGAAGWAVGGALALAGAHGLGLWRGIGAIDGDGRVHVPGSWVPLALKLGLFGVKFGVGVAMALQSGLGTQWPFVGAVGVVYGLFSGVFLARAWAAWTAARGVPGRRVLPTAMCAAR